MTTNEPQGERLDAIRWALKLLKKFGNGATVNAVLEDAPEELARAEAALSAMAALKAERDQLRATLAGIIEIGKRDMSNPKYDGYFASARAALNAAKVGGVR